MKLTGRTVLITGGTSGIGLELAAQLLARKNVVIVTGQDDKGIDAAKSRHPALSAYKSDVGDKDEIRRLHADVTARFPQLDTLVNNAGIMRNLQLAEERSLEDVTQEIDIDLSGPIRMVQQFLPHLRRRSDALIVMVSSGIAFVPFSIAPVYSATKAGVRAYARCLRTQLADSGVTVVELAPPGTETPLMKAEFAKMDGPRNMPVETLVGHLLTGSERGRTNIRPGLSKVLSIAGRVAPDLVFNQMSKAAAA
jgi:uncharacterized oxidoreductase